LRSKRAFSCCLCCNYFHSRCRKARAFCCPCSRQEKSSSSSSKECNRIPPPTHLFSNHDYVGVRFLSSTMTMQYMLHLRKREALLWKKASDVNNAQKYIHCFSIRICLT
jgi:hypothetical protein